MTAIRDYLDQLARVENYKLILRASFRLRGAPTGRRPSGNRLMAHVYVHLLRRHRARLDELRTAADLAPPAPPDLERRTLSACLGEAAVTLAPT